MRPRATSPAMSGSTPSPPAVPTMEEPVLRCGTATVAVTTYRAGRPSPTGNCGRPADRRVARPTCTPSAYRYLEEDLRVQPEQTRSRQPSRASIVSGLEFPVSAVQIGFYHRLAQTEKGRGFGRRTKAWGGGRGARG